MKIGDLYWALRADGAQLEPDVTKAAQKAGDSGGKILGDRMAARIRTAIGAGLGGLFVGAVDAATSFQDQLATINTVAKVSDSQLQQIGDDIQELSRKSGKTTDDLTQGFYDLVSAGVPADKAMKTLSDSAILAIGSLGSTAEAVDLVTSSLGAYNLGAENSGRVTDIWAQAVADGKTTVADLAHGISQVAPIAAAAGVSIEEVAAQTAVMTINGDTASQAMTRIKTAISALLTPNATLNEIQKRTGINFANLAKEKGLAVALDELRKATNGNNEEFGKALGASEALTLAFSITGDNAGKMADELAKVKGGADKGGVALEQFNIKSSSAAEAGKRLAAQIQTFIQDVGGPFVNSVGPAVFALNQLGGAFGRGGIAAKLFGGVLGGLTGRFLPALVKAFAAAEIGTRLETLGLFLQTKLIKGLIVKDRIVDAIQGLWERVLYSGPVQKVIGIAGSIAGAIYGAAVGVGSKIAEALSGAWGRIPGSALVGAAIRSAATAAFGLFSAGLAAAAVAAPIVIPIVLLGQIKLPDPAGARNALDEGLHNQGLRSPEEVLAGVGLPTPDQAATVGQEVVGAYLQAALTSVQRENRTSSPVATGFSKFVTTVIDAAGAAARKQAHRLGLLAGEAVSQGIRAQRDHVDQAWQAMLDGIKNSTSVTERTAHLLGLLISKELQKGLHDADPASRAQARATKQLILDELASLKPRAGTLGKDAIDAVRKGMKSKDPDIRAAATAIWNTIHTHLPDKADGTAWGTSIGAGLVAGMKAYYRQIGQVAGTMAGIIASYIKTHSPAEVGPLSEDGGPEGMGRNIGLGLTRGLSAALPNIGAMLGGSLAMPALATAGASVSGGDTFNFGDIHLHGVGSDVSPAAADRFGRQIADVLRREGRRTGLHPRKA